MYILQKIANKGFNIHNSAGIYCAEAKVPPFTRGKNQIGKKEVDVSRQLPRLCIHVEKVIGVVRQKYTILQSTLSVNLTRVKTSFCKKPLRVCLKVCKLCIKVG